MSRPLALLLVGALLASFAAHADDRAPPRDPMQPYGRGSAGGVVGVAAGPRFTLTAVLISSERRVAILNGKPRLQGDRIDGAEIVRIDADGVRLRDRGGEIVVPLGRNAATRAPKFQGETAP